MIRTNVPAGEMAPEEAVRAYKSLEPGRARLPQLQGGRPQGPARPPPPREAASAPTSSSACSPTTSSGTCAAPLAPLLFDDDDPAAAEAARSSPVAPARRSPSARAKAGGKRTPDGLPVHSFQTLLGDLATLTRNRVRPAVPGAMTADILARPTPLQAKAFRLLGVRP